MLPIDYEDLGAEEVKSLQEWFAAPAYQTLQEVIQAKLVQLAEQVIKGIGDGSPEQLIKDDALETQQLQVVLDLLEAIAQGYHGSDESNLFQYQRMKAKL